MGQPLLAPHLFAWAQAWRCLSGWGPATASIQEPDPPISLQPTLHLGVRWLADLGICEGTGTVSGHPGPTSGHP